MKVVAEMRGTSLTSVLDGEVLDVGGGVEVEPESEGSGKWAEVGDGSRREEAEESGCSEGGARGV